MNAHVKPELDVNHLLNSALALESALIGACISTPLAAHRAMGIVQPHHFKEELHQALWSAVVEMVTDGRPVSMPTLLAKVGRAEFEHMSLSQYIAKCAANTSCPPAYVADYARQVRECWGLRQVMEQGDLARYAAALPGANAKALISELINSLDETRAVIDGKVRNGRSLGAITASIIDSGNRRRQGEIVGDEPITTGLRDLDRKLMGGFRPGQLIIIGGRPGMGKTTVGVSVSRQMSKAGAPGVMFSLEMPEEQIASRFIADELYSSTGTLTAGAILQADKLSNGDFERICLAERDLESRPLLVDDTSNLTVGELGARCRSHAQRLERVGKRLQFVVVDYLKFLKASDRYRGQRHYEVGEISGGLKSLAKDLNIAVILLVQLNREVEKRAEKKPELSDLRESGDLEADADIVMLLFREAYYLANDPNADKHRLSEVENKLDVIIAKQRMGSTGTVELFCHAGASAVRDLMRY